MSEKCNITLNQGLIYFIKKILESERGGEISDDELVKMIVDTSKELNAIVTDMPTPSDGGK